jgi:hypothetical protein
MLLDLNTFTAMATKLGTKEIKETAAAIVQ